MHSAKRPTNTTPLQSATDPVDEKIAGLGDWRGEVLAKVRELVKRADEEIVEDVKWRKPTNPGGVPVWSRAGIICTGETYKDKVKLTFLRGAGLDDPHSLFNAGLDGGTRRAIDLRAGDKLDEEAFIELVRAAVRINLSC
jgi:hypothetical protein